jgi:hypothetical protein
LLAEAPEVVPILDVTAEAELVVLKNHLRPSCLAHTQSWSELAEVDKVYQVQILALFP